MSFDNTKKCLVFRDINPVAKVHMLVIPKNREGLTGIDKAEERHEKKLGHLFVVAAKVAAQEGLGDGYRLVINNGKHGGIFLFNLLF